MLLISCSSTKESLTNTEYEKQESEYARDAHYTASENERKDSVFIHDSVFVLVGFDTIREIRYRTIYRDRWRTRVDTLYIERDKTSKSIAAEVKQNEIVSVVEKRYVPPWVWILVAINAVIVIITVAYGGWRLVLYVKKRFGF